MLNWICQWAWKRTADLNHCWRQIRWVWSLVVDCHQVGRNLYSRDIVRLFSSLLPMKVCISQIHQTPRNVISGLQLFANVIICVEQGVLLFPVHYSLLFIIVFDFFHSNLYSKEIIIFLQTMHDFSIYVTIFFSDFNLLFPNFPNCSFFQWKIEISMNKFKK